MGTVMIVDDDPAIREIFTAYLQRAGYEVVAAGGGMECLALLRTSTPDIILLDLMMEPMDGWETLRAIQDCPAARQVPVIIITGKHPVPDDIVLYGGLIDGFVVKPVEFRKIVACLDGTIENYRDLDRMTLQRRQDPKDTVLVAEYIRLLRLVRITYNLKRRFRDLPWADRISLADQEKRLMWLHTRLGLPDRFLERHEGG